jgi:hypothetical protein
MDKNIYGKVPEPKGDAKMAVKDAFVDLDDSFSNSINGPVNDKRDSNYDPEEGK